MDAEHAKEQHTVVVLFTFAVASTANVSTTGVGDKGFFFLDLLPLLRFLGVTILVIGGIGRRGSLFEGNNKLDEGKMGKGLILKSLVSSSRIFALRISFSFCEISNLACKEAIFSSQAVCIVELEDSENSLSTTSKESPCNKSEKN